MLSNNKINVSIFIPLVLTLTLVQGCSHTVNYKPIVSVESRNTSGSIKVYEKGEKIENGYKIVGTLWLGESGFSESCGYEDALFLAREKAREIGADAIQVNKVKKPDFISTCYRVGLNIIEFK